MPNSAKQPVLGEVLRYPHFESFAVEWKGTKTELTSFAQSLLGTEWQVSRLSGNDWEIFNPAHLKGGWEPMRAVAPHDPSQPASSELPPGQAWALARKIRKHPKARYAEPLFAVYAPPPENPGDSAALSGGDAAEIPGALQNCEWALDKAGVLAAWAMSSKRGEGVRVAHPDTGYQIHPELDLDRLLLSEDRDLLEDDDDALDPLADGFMDNPGHGTATGSVIISARGTTAPFVSGVAPGARLIPLRTSPQVVLLSMRNLIRAIDYAIQKKAHVVSISMGGLGSFALQKVLQRATKAGLIVVAAAGNKVKFVVYPGGYPEAVCMAATNFNDKPWKGSCRGPEVTIAAPGESVWRARIFHRAGQVQRTVETSHGTSYATAMVAGVAALWLSHHGRANLIAMIGGERFLAGTFKNILMSTVRKPAGWPTGKYGTGIVNAKAVLEADPRLFVPTAVSAKKSAVTPDLEVRRRLANLAGIPASGDAAITRAIGGLSGAATGRATPARMADLGPEIAFLAATDPAVRRALEAAAKQSGRKGLAAAAAGTDGVESLRRALTKRQSAISATASEELGL